jgi:hypothetical protein
MYNKGIQETTTTEENKMKLQQQIIFDQVQLPLKGIDKTADLCIIEKTTQH